MNSAFFEEEDKPAPVASATERQLLLSAGALTLLGDFLLWPATPGLSLGLFAVLAATILMLNRPRSSVTPTTVAAALMLLASAVQSAYETSFSNLLVIGLLLLVLLGETSFPALKRGWTRWSEAVWALVKAPALWWWVRQVVKSWPKRFKTPERRQPVDLLGSQPVEDLPAPAPSQPGGIELLIRVIAPTLAVGLVFALLLGSGNAIFARGLSQAVTLLWDVIPGIDLSIGRLCFRVALATAALGLLRPSVPAESVRRLWTFTIPKFPAPRDPTFTRLRSLSILGLLNALFFAVNTVDGVYLWLHGRLPEGINYSTFVHQGVQSLVAAVLLSGFVLVAIYHQSDTVTSHRWLRWLALGWVLQNVLLIASVLLRLKLYIEAYQLTELRVYVSFFLLLVSAGFALLAWRIIANKSLNWLLFANGCAAFGLFFCVQFLDVSRRVAETNVARWQSDSKRTLDIEYLGRLGSSAYPSLITVAQTTNRPESAEARRLIEQRRNLEHDYLDGLDWRSLQVRRARLALELLGK